MLAEHVYLAFLPLLIGLAIAMPLGFVVARAGWWRGSRLSLLMVLEAVPALAWFVILPGLLGTRLDAHTNVIVGLALFASAVLTQAVVLAVRDVPAELSRTAEAVGFGVVARAVRVELPVAAPGLIAAVRTTMVSCICLVTLAALLGAGGLGEVLTEGFATGTEAEILFGTAVVIALAAVAENLLTRTQRRVMPWSTLVPVR